MKKKKSSGGANWMDTYGDMVTLLLCFFVLLYSMSSIDQEKWMLIVQSFNKNAIVSTDDTPRGPEGDDGKEGGNDMPMTQDEVEMALDELHQFLQDYVQQENMESSTTVSRGDGYVFISFNDAVFFDGDSYVLRPDGKEALNGIIPALAQAGPFIDELRVLGHTAQAVADQPNNPTTDRFLAGNRASVVLVYLQENIAQEQLDPARLVGVQYGQWRPIAPNDTRDTRAQNRRVELIITGRDLEDSLSDSIKQYYTMANRPYDPQEEELPLENLSPEGQPSEDLPLTDAVTDTAQPDVQADGSSSESADAPAA